MYDLNASPAPQMSFTGTPGGSHEHEMTLAEVVRRGLEHMA